MRLIVTVLLVILVVGTIVVTAAVLNFNRNKCTLRTKMRALWTDHVVWTREFLIAFLLKQPNLTAAQNRLMQNQQQIGAAFGSYFGDSSGTQLTALLVTHIQQSVVVVQSLGDPTKLAAAMADWQANAQQIGQFIRTYTGVDFTNCMLDHLTMTSKEAIDLNNANYVQAVSDFDSVLKEITHDMADKMTNAIARKKWFLLATTMTTLPCCH